VKWNAKFRRRLFGAVCLGVAGVMLLVGETNPPSGASPGAFVRYWLACFGFAILAIAAAVLDLRAVRREAREVQRDLLADALQTIEAEKRRRQAAPGRNDASDLKD
jgi:membrane protein implicated in regulation of membrane protease activity